jgi:hypothetical protein
LEKQKHAAIKIYERLVDEYDFKESATNMDPEGYSKEIVIQFSSIMVAKKGWGRKDSKRSNKKGVIERRSDCFLFLRTT